MKRTALIGRLRQKNWGTWSKQQLPRLGLVLVGFLLAALVFGVRSCGGDDRPKGHVHTESADAKDAVWTCSMHPQIRKNEPGQCPICGMDLIPVEAGDDGDDADPSKIVLSERARALAELRTTAVQRRSDTSAQLQLLGRLEPDETSLKTVTAWTGGRIDRLHVNVTGQRVRRGQVIATLYSPEVYAAHQDLLVAKQQTQRLASGPDSSQNAANAVLEAARQRLRLLGVPDDQVARMEEQKSPTRAVAIRTPFGGTVIERMASEGAYVTTGAPLYKVADLDTLWVQLDAYESDLARLSEGQEVEVKVEAFPGEPFDGKVTFIDPTIDPQRRTAQVRVAIENPEGRLRPGMFAEAVVHAKAPSDQREPLVIPDSAPLFTGQSAVVYVEVHKGERVAYEPRTVRLGPKLGEYYPVVAGLSEGERVVTRGAFAVDADLQIRGGPSMMTASDDREAGAWDAAIELPASQLERLVPLIQEYLAIQKALAEDSLERAQKAATALEKAAASIQIEQPREATIAWRDLAQTLRNHAAHAVRAEDLETARTGFEGLSDGIADLLRTFGNPLKEPLHLAFCPMAFGSQGATWVQQGTEIDNAYFGESMRTCGEVKTSVPPGSYLRREKAKDPKSKTSGGYQH